MTPVFYTFAASRRQAGAFFHQLKAKDMNIALLNSGGVDSAVAVHLLCEQGYKPDLFYIKIGMDDDGLTCTAEEDMELSQATARKYRVLF